MENLEHKLNILGKMEQAELNPFLLTRIKQQIENSSHFYYPKKFVWSAGISLVILLSFNVIRIVSANHSGIEKNLVTEFNLMQNNTLYK